MMKTTLTRTTADAEPTAIFARDTETGAESTTDLTARDNAYFGRTLYGTLYRVDFAVNAERNLNGATIYRVRYSLGETHIRLMGSRRRGGTTYANVHDALHAVAKMALVEMLHAIDTSKPFGDARPLMEEMERTPVDTAGLSSREIETIRLMAQSILNMVSPTATGGNPTVTLKMIASIQNAANVISNEACGPESRANCWDSRWVESAD